MHTVPHRRRSTLLITLAAILLAPLAQAEPSRRYVPDKQAMASEADADSDAENDPGDDEATDENEGNTSSRCTGKATFCAVYAQPFCNSQPGCAYSFALNLCTGVALKCESATNEAFCGKIKGCQWK